MVSFFLNSQLQQHVYCLHVATNSWYGLCTAKQRTSVRDFRPPPRCKRDLRSFRTLRSVQRQFRTDVSGQPIGPIFKGQAVQDNYLTLEDGTDRFSRNVGAELPL